MQCKIGSRFFTILSRDPDGRSISNFYRFVITLPATVKIAKKKKKICNVPLNDATNGGSCFQ